MSTKTILAILAVVVGVMIVGVVMAATGGSRDVFMGLVLFGASAMLFWSIVKYRKNPTYIRDGKEQKVGPVMLGFMAVLAIVLLLGGLYTMIVGFPVDS